MGGAEMLHDVWEGVGIGEIQTYLRVARSTPPVYYYLNPACSQYYVTNNLNCPPAGGGSCA